MFFATTYSTYIITPPPLSQGFKPHFVETRSMSEAMVDQEPLNIQTNNQKHFFKSVSFAISLTELDSSGSYGQGSSSTLPIRGNRPTSGLNGHAHHVPHLHPKSGQDSEIVKLKNFVKHLQVRKCFLCKVVLELCLSLHYTSNLFFCYFAS